MDTKLIGEQITRYRKGRNLTQEELGKAVGVSTQAASRAGRVLFIKDGVIFNQIYRGRLSDDEMYQKISDTLTVLHTESRHAQRFEQEA